jgi:hypothetical protein
MKAFRILLIVMGILSLTISTMMVVQSERLRTERAAARAAQASRGDSASDAVSGCGHAARSACCNH